MACRLRHAIGAGLAAWLLVAGLGGSAVALEPVGGLVDDARKTADAAAGTARGTVDDALPAPSDDTDVPASSDAAPDDRSTPDPVPTPKATLDPAPPRAAGKTASPPGLAGNAGDPPKSAGSAKPGEAAKGVVDRATDTVHKTVGSASETVERTGDAVDDTVDDITETTDTVGDTAETLTRSTDEALRDTTDVVGDVIDGITGDPGSPPDAGGSDGDSGGSSPPPSAPGGDRRPPRGADPRADGPGSNDPAGSATDGAVAAGSNELLTEIAQLDGTTAGDADGAGGASDRGADLSELAQVPTGPGAGGPRPFDVPAYLLVTAAVLIVAVGAGHVARGAQGLRAA